MSALRWLVVFTAFCLVVPVAFGQGGKDVKKKEYTFTGKIEKVNAEKNTLRVNGADVPGWMAAMTMDYEVDKPETLKTLKVGDQITAKVYDGDFKVLHDVKVTPPAPAKK